MARNQGVNPSEIDLRQQVESDIRNLADGSLAEGAKQLFATLGYESIRKAPALADNSPDTFLKQLPANVLDTKSGQEFREKVSTVNLLFQVIDDDIRRAGDAQAEMFQQSDSETDNTINDSFFFAVAELKGNTYPRGAYASFAREINKRLPIATVVLMRTPNGKVSLAFVDRRKHKRLEGRAVLGNVALLREIDTSDPHRAHLDILCDLDLDTRLDWMRTNEKPNNFTGLLASWLAVLNTEELNKRFYKGLYEWYKRAITEARLPTKHEPVEEQVIRLITRLMFIWFIKEKGFVARELFNETQVKAMLKDYDHQHGDSYYRCVLQNLFFGTLNTPVDDRRFAPGSDADESAWDTNDMFTLNFVDEIDRVDELLDSFHISPFINGGLFECLDGRDPNGDFQLVDGFVDDPNVRNSISVPNRLFFDDAGLITLFDSFRFTVEESTPLEQEVALDPELLGNVFESLLAAYVPETSSTKQAQTGTYYTPRQVVDYMVDEALTESLLARGFGSEQTKDADRDRLLALFDYRIEAGSWSDDEAKLLVGLIAETKVLDPAVGSGAFPMAALHKMTLALRKIDPENQLWHEHQKHIAVSRTETAFDVPRHQERNEMLDEISEVFETYRSGDYGRKLFLIQNCMFGVDIQPIAVQIAKLRFFISLAIEQETNSDAYNYGIRALPNLETRFVIADSLLPLTRWENQKTLAHTDEVASRVKELLANRERYFRAYDPWGKGRLRANDAHTRSDLARTLRDRGMPESDADRLAAWDPFDQSAVSEWFDPEFMFGVSDGFDVVIGNPPYRQLQDNDGELNQKYSDQGFDTHHSEGDLYQLFYEKGCGFTTRPKGLLAFITSNSWMRTRSGGKTREFLREQKVPLRLIELGKDTFDAAIVDTNVLIVANRAIPAECKAIDMDRITHESFPPFEQDWGSLVAESSSPWSVLAYDEVPVFRRVSQVGTPLIDWPISLRQGVTTGRNKAFIVDEERKSSILQEDSRSADVIRAVVRGRNVRKYRITSGKEYILDVHNGTSAYPPVDISEYPAIKRHLDQFMPDLKKRDQKGHTPYHIRSCSFHAKYDEPKLIWQTSSDEGRFAFDREGLMCIDSAYIVTGDEITLRFLAAILNSRLLSWWMQRTAPNTGMGLTQWKKFAVERIPVPDVSEEFMSKMAVRVDEVQALKTSQDEEGASEAMRKIDEVVYDLYGLTEEEIAVVEDAMAGG